jgi:chemotaxis response regulator CheB
VISQHIPKAFSGPFARRVDSVSALSVCQARDGQQLLPGHVYSPRGTDTCWCPEMGPATSAISATGPR